GDGRVQGVWAGQATAATPVPARGQEAGRLAAGAWRREGPAEHQARTVGNCQGTTGRARRPASAEGGTDAESLRRAAVRRGQRFPPDPLLRYRQGREIPNRGTDSGPQV